MISIRKRAMRGLRNGLESYLTPEQPSAEVEKEANRLRQDAARIRQYTAKIRALKAAGVSKDDAIRVKQMGVQKVPIQGTFGWNYGSPLWDKKDETTYFHMDLDN